MPTAQEVRETISRAYSQMSEEKLKNAQIAFFGGSFTAIDRELMISYLEATRGFVGEGKIPSIRLSTRPDAIDEEILSILKSYGVRSIELGCQSMAQDVLDKNNRGHKVSDTIKSAELIKKSGFELGVQMMVGLYGDTREKCLETARELASLEPVTARIYPTIVIKNTPLETLYNQGKYKPLSIDEAVDISSAVLEIFEEKGINVIRLGLHSEESLKNDMVAGPFHDAFRELCEGEILFKKALSILEKNEIQRGREINIFVNPSSISKMIGHRRRNILRLEEMGYRIRVREDSLLDRLSVRIGEEVKF